MSQQSIVYSFYSDPNISYNYIVYGFIFSNHINYRVRKNKLRFRIIIIIDQYLTNSNYRNVQSIVSLIILCLNIIVCLYQTDCYLLVISENHCYNQLNFE